MAGTPEYTAWGGMKARCLYPSHRGWENYGARGIKVCNEWLNDFAAFYAHVGPRPSPDHSIDRIKNDRDYEPGNVRWATRAEQNRNRRNSVIITAWGRSQVVTDWSHETGLDPKVIHKRIQQGWPAEEALTRPANIWASRRYREQIAPG